MKYINYSGSSLVSSKRYTELTQFMPRDAKKFLHHFDEYEHLSREQKVEIINALYAIAENFADLAFGVHPMQMGMKDPMTMWHKVVEALEGDPETDEGRAIMSKFIAHFSAE